MSDRTLWTQWMIGALLLCASLALAAEPSAIAAETPADAAARHARVAERRKGPHIICHRGSAEFAHENTLEAYRATFELGADGNEIDIRATKDGVLICFHDDMLDQLLVACGDASDYTWEELQRFPFREPGAYGPQCRIPTLQETLELHRKYAGLIHLDVKRPNLDRAIAELLDRLDLWDHVAYCNRDNGAAIVENPRTVLCRYRASVYLDRGDVFPAALQAAVQKPGEGLLVDDPRGAVFALSRKLGRVSKEPVQPQEILPKASSAPPPNETELLAVLRDDADWNRVAESEADRAASGRLIVRRARAADDARLVKAPSPALLEALADRVRRRSLHKDWQFHGLDGALALRSLIVLKAPQAPELARFVLWRDDPALEPVVNPRWQNPRAWTDFRCKMVIFRAFALSANASGEQVCRDYLALDDEQAKQLAPPMFQEAARALLAISPSAETAAELMQHRLQVVRGRAILDCVAQSHEPWSRKALAKVAPFAFGYTFGD